jgi:hypothetical protein
MFPHPRPAVYVAALSISSGGFHTIDSQAGWIDLNTALAAACSLIRQPTNFKGA